MGSFEEHMKSIPADYVGFKCERVFTHVLDDTVVKIINLGYNTFIWIQYGPTEGGLSVDVAKQYNEEEVRKMVEHLQPYNKDISASDLFEKFLNT